jgi:phage tail sheath gpL-like
MDDVVRFVGSGDAFGSGGRFQTCILCEIAGKRFLLTERQSLLNTGIATSYVAGGLLRVERAITTYQKNTWSQPDPSYLDSETLHQSAYIIRYLRNRITQKYPRHKLANDGTRFGAGQAIVTPNVIRGELLAAYSDMELDGIVENAKAFAAALIVERDTNNPNRVNVLLPPDYVNQLRVFALLNQFRLNYSASA